MTTKLTFAMNLKDGRHLEIEGLFSPYRHSTGPYPGDPPEPADIELTKCDANGVYYEPTEMEMEEIVARAEDIYYVGMVSCVDPADMCV